MSLTNSSTSILFFTFCSFILLYPTLSTYTIVSTEKNISFNYICRFEWPNERMYLFGFNFEITSNTLPQVVVKPLILVFCSILAHPPQYTLVVIIVFLLYSSSKYLFIIIFTFHLHLHFTSSLPLVIVLFSVGTLSAFLYISAISMSVNHPFALDSYVSNVVRSDWSHYILS